MQHWFVYYKVDPPAARELEPRLRQMQLEAAGSDVRPRLMRRADDAAGVVTLMEVYDGIARPADFGVRLAEAVRRADLPPALLTQRRIERFEDA